MTWNCPQAKKCDVVIWNRMYVKFWYIMTSKVYFYIKYYLSLKVYVQCNEFCFILFRHNGNVNDEVYGLSNKG